MGFTQLTLENFLDQLASATPAPGGGTAAALSGAIGASLVAMVTALTVGKKGYEGVQAELAGIREQANTIRANLSALMDADSKSYERVVEVLKLARDTEEQRATREKALQDALKLASRIPFQIASECERLLGLARGVAEHGIKSASSDVGVGALLADAGMRGAILNIEINLKAIHDETFVREMREAVSQLATRRASVIEIINTVERRM